MSDHFKQPKNIKILGLGKFLPPQKVSAKALAAKINTTEEWVIKKSGVHYRHFVTDETNSQMGALAAKAALEDAGLTIHDIDALICASGSVEKLIPCTASLIHRELHISHKPIPAYDVNSTCLGFITAFDLASCLIAQGRYKKMLLISTEVASKGLDWDDHESCTLFGDGAAAAVVGVNESPIGSKLIAAHMETYSEGADFCQLLWGIPLHPTRCVEANHKSYLFQMDGPKVFKLASAHLDRFVAQMLESNGLKMDDLKMVVPHQASAMAMRVIQKKLNLSGDRFMNIIADHGNVIAASIPMALHEAIKRGLIMRGDLILLLGTSAGLSLGGAIIEY